MNTAAEIHVLGCFLEERLPCFVNQGGKVLFTVKQRSNHPPPLYQRTSQQQAKNCPPSIATLKKVQNMKYVPVPLLLTINTDRQLRQTFSTEAPDPSPQVFVLSAYYIVPENSKPFKTELSKKLLASLVRFK